MPPANALIESIPDLVLLLRRDGSVIAHAGGHGVADLRPAGEPESDRYEPTWSAPTAALIKQLVRKAIAQRTATESHFRERDRQYEVRVTPQGPDRALCLIRSMTEAAREESTDTTGDRPRPELDRRGFLRRFKESLAVATLQEKSIAVAVLYVDGLADIAQIISAKLSEQIMSTALLRLSAQAGASSGRPAWYLGQLGENILALVVETSNREAIEASVSAVCESLREPVSLGDAEFRLTPYAGVGVLGLDATSPRALLDHARAAAAEARRAGSERVHFFSDTLQLRTLARLDIARELREAIANRHIRFRYVGRHDLQTGRVVAWVAYVQWLHPLRGEIRPTEFLRVAETTGLGTSLSRSVLTCLGEDFAAFKAKSDPDVRLSFGALRSHVLHEDFVADVENFLGESGVPPERLELRIAEKSFVARDPREFQALHKRGVRLVVDEVARGMGSLPWFARAPLWGLQLDRAWVTALRTDEVARKVCRAGISVAAALGLTPIATGVDDEAQRDALLELGCRYGTGDLYRAVESNISERSANAGSP